uniref:30S ribosomal protein S14 n=1 Tax=Micractinium conductrix TaxID=554055 RepID=A0A2I4S768_9CHLO|nr:30S ribosomal protein S14 [Micractinium conductrix]
MTNFIQRDQKRRSIYSKYELKRVELASIINDLTIAKEVRSQSIKELNKLPRNSSQIRVKNRCILTGRGHSVLSFCGLSRLKFRELASQGLLMGITKASW